jgi:hypothetical protein
MAQVADVVDACEAEVLKAAATPNATKLTSKEQRAKRFDLRGKQLVPQWHEHSADIACLYAYCTVLAFIAVQYLPATTPKNGHHFVTYPSDRLRRG